MVDQDANPGRLQNGCHLEQLVALDLDVGEHVQMQRASRSSASVSRKCSTPSREACIVVPDDAAVAQPLQVAAAGVVVDDGDTLEPTVAAFEEVQQTPVVRVVSRIGADDQRVSGAVGIEEVGQLVRGALLVGDRVVPGVGRISEMCGIEKVVVTIHLRFVIDRHGISFPGEPSHGEALSRCVRAGGTAVHDPSSVERKNRTISADASGPSDRCRTRPGYRRTTRARRHARVQDSTRTEPSASRCTVRVHARPVVGSSRLVVSEIEGDAVASRR